MSNRRTFIQQAGLISAGLLISPSLLLAEGWKEKIVGIQLYTLRDYIRKDVKGVLSKVVKAGFKDVETFGYDQKNRFFGLEPKDFKELIGSLGLMSTCGHYNPNDFLNGKGTDELKYFIDAALILKQQHLIIPWLPEELRKSADDYKSFAEKLNIAGELCDKAGLQLAYHNHDFEFKPYGAENGYDILLRETDQNLVDFELDLYWITRAGRDPLDYFKQYPGRFKAWHVKDMDKNDPKKFTEVGSGSIDLKRIFAQAKLAGVQHFFVEQDQIAIDPFVSIAKSCSYVKNTLLV